MRMRLIDAEPLKELFPDNGEGSWTYNATAKAYIDAQPTIEPDIIRCKDCKWYGRADKRRFYRGMDCLQKRIDTIVPDRDFCSKAERRTKNADVNT